MPTDTQEGYLLANGFLHVGTTFIFSRCHGLFRVNRNKQRRRKGKAINVTVFKLIHLRTRRTDLKLHSLACNSYLNDATVPAVLVQKRRRRPQTVKLFLISTTRYGIGQVWISKCHPIRDLPGKKRMYG
ncbi:hypothetical protein WN48_00645 [Eufriesea mexicana]|uniref:Uncharacterized protein n=1 Tax=Eufriesea mexicana TaxID=516756 RepID=A0A310SEB3_9HYME|nr:hypothetical protein WN48_00645 [Eufriesea mexicana]